MVLREGLEPSRPYGQRILSPLCLPIPPPERDALVKISKIGSRWGCLYYNLHRVRLHELRQSAPVVVHKVISRARVAVRARCTMSRARGAYTWCELSCAEGAVVSHLLYLSWNVRQIVRGKAYPARDARRRMSCAEGALLILAVLAGLEPAASCVTGRYSNQLNYSTKIKFPSFGLPIRSQPLLPKGTGVRAPRSRPD